MPADRTTRRSFLASTALFSAGAALGPQMARATPGAADTFAYEVTRTEEEWRAMLTRNEYRIMRDGGTEWQRSSEYWDSEEVGTYCCKGCQKSQLSAIRKAIRWQRFEHSTNSRQSSPSLVNSFNPICWKIRRWWSRPVRMSF